MMDWLNKKKDDVLNTIGKELFFLLVGACIYYSISMFIMDTLKAPRLTAEHPMIDGAIYITICFMITIFIIILISFILQFNWSITFKRITPMENGVVDKNLDGMTVDMLIERLEEFDSKSLILLEKNCIVIIAKDSIKLNKG